MCYAGGAALSGLRGNNVVLYFMRAFFKGLVMPTISMFYGLIICLYFYDNERHNLPHIHAK